MADATLCSVKNMQPCRFLRSSEGTRFVPLSDLHTILFLATAFRSQSNWRGMELGYECQNTCETV